jgi:hypothetical protein
MQQRNYYLRKNRGNKWGNKKENFYFIDFLTRNCSKLRGYTSLYIF